MIDLIERFRDWLIDGWLLIFTVTMMVAAALGWILLIYLAAQAHEQNDIRLTMTPSASELVHSTEEAEALGELFVSDTATPTATPTPSPTATPLAAEGRIVCPPDHACGDEGMAFYAEMCDMGAIPDFEWPCAAVRAWRSGGQWDYRWFEPDSRRLNG